eukprot:836737_1
MALKLEPQTSLPLFQSETGDVHTEFASIQPETDVQPNIEISDTIQDELHYNDNTYTINQNSNTPFNQRIAIRDEIALCVSESAKLRIRVVDELIETEKTYVECLNNLITHFMRPLQSEIDGKLLISKIE